MSCQVNLDSGRFLNGANADNPDGSDLCNYMHQVLDAMKSRLQSDEDRALCQKGSVLGGHSPELLEQWGAQIEQANFGGEIAQLDRLSSMIEKSQDLQDPSSGSLALFTEALTNISSLLSSSQTFALQQLITMIDASKRKMVQIANDPALNPAQKREEIFNVLREALDAMRKCVATAHLQHEQQPLTPSKHEAFSPLPTSA